MLSWFGVGFTGVGALGATARAPMTSTFSMMTGFMGASALNAPLAPVGVSPMRSMTSIPCTTLPNTV